MNSLLSPIQVSVLDKIASGEADSYQEIYGGHRFLSFHDHPQIAIPLPGGKGFSTAAGRYQMTAPTWQEEKSRLGLPDFSPESQDLAAWDLAQRTYRANTGGRDLTADQASGVTDWNALANQWTSLKQKSGARPLLSTAQLPAPGPTLQPLQFDSSPNLTPVEHDPWSLTPTLVPVSHNPFIQESSNATE